MERQPGGTAAAAVFRSQAAGWVHALVDAAYAGARQEGAQRSITDETLRLAPQEARDLTAELAEVLNAGVVRTRGRDPERATHSYLAMLQPLPEAGRTGATS